MLLYLLQNNFLISFFIVLSLVCISYIVLTNHLVYAILGLIGTFLCFVSLFFLMDATLIGVIFILVYVGAICIFLLFIVINFNLQIQNNISVKQKFLKVIMFILLYICLISIYESYPLYISKGDYYYYLLNFYENMNLLEFYESSDLYNQKLNINENKWLLFTNTQSLFLYLFLHCSSVFFFLSLLLYVAMLGSLYITFLLKKYNK